MKTNKQSQPMLATALASLKPLNLSQLLLTQPAPVLFGQALTRTLNRAGFHTRVATLRLYHRTAGQLSRVFGARDIRAIPLADFEAFLASLHKSTGEPLSAASKNRYVSLIRMAMREAGYRGGAPRLRLMLRKAPRFYTTTEVARMIAAVRPEERGYVIVQSHFGLRPGEALQLLPEHIDLIDRTITLGGTCIDRMVRVIEGQHGASSFGSYVPDGAWRLLAAFPFRPLQRSPRTVQQVMQRAVGRWIPGGLRMTAAFNIVALTGRSGAAHTLGVPRARLKSHFVPLTTFAQARDYFDLDPGQFAQAAA